MRPAVLTIALCAAAALAIAPGCAAPAAGKPGPHAHQGAHAHHGGRMAAETGMMKGDPMGQHFLRRAETDLSHADAVAAVKRAVADKGLRLFTEIDHAGGARSIGEEIAPTTVLIFGSPKAGAPLMKLDPVAGLDLPLRLVVTTVDGRTVLTHYDPGLLAAHHAIPEDHPVLERMRGIFGAIKAEAKAELVEVAAAH